MYEPKTKWLSSAIRSPNREKCREKAGMLGPSSRGLPGVIGRGMFAWHGVKETRWRFKAMAMIIHSSRLFMMAMECACIGCAQLVGLNVM